MSKLFITTQTYENYGDAVNPYWKPKGGSDYFVNDFDTNNNVAEVVGMVRPQIECDNEYYREFIISHEIVSDDYLTEFEQSQLDYEGQIRFPAKVLSI